MSGGVPPLRARVNGMTLVREPGLVHTSRSSPRAEPVPMISFRPDLVKALLPERERERITAYALDDAGVGTDVFGTSAEGIGNAYAVAYWLHRYYFRVQSEGHAYIPSDGAAVVI